MTTCSTPHARLRPSVAPPEKDGRAALFRALRSSGGGIRTRDASGYEIDGLTSVERDVLERWIERLLSELEIEAVWLLGPGLAREQA